jgi:hemerythrin
MFRAAGPGDPFPVGAGAMEDHQVSPIAWAEVLETGVPELDADHRALIDQCNTLTNLMESGAAWAKVVDSARELAQGCTEHFRAEEALLDETEFPRREQHKAQHRQIERRFNELVAFLATGDGSRAEHRKAARAVRATLVDILFRHDLDYKSHLQHIAGR